MEDDKLNFVQLLSAHRRGELVHEMDDLLAEMLAAINEYGGKGELSLKLSFKGNEAGQIEMQATPQMKKPRRTMGVGIFYHADGGKLSRNDPKQDDFLNDLDAARQRRREHDA